jgi:hypothetical protein
MRFLCIGAEVRFFLTLGVKSGFLTDRQMMFGSSSKRLCWARRSHRLVGRGGDLDYDPAA